MQRVVSPDDPIAVLDSGLGGLTAARVLRAMLPNEQIIYFGDTARSPFGSKSAETVSAFVRQAIVYLRTHNPKHIVIACNTASAMALPVMRAAFADTSISGVVEPGARAAVEAAGAKAVPMIGILATEATIWSKAYERAIHRRRHHARLLLRPTPLLVSLVEEGRDENDAVVKLAVQQYLQPLVQRGVDVLVLGCTHYTLLKELIARTVGKQTVLIDSAQQCAEDVARRLQATGLLRGGPVGGAGGLRCFVTDESPRFRPLARRFFGADVEAPTLVSTRELDALDAAQSTVDALRASA
ncbi:MAG: glutamate racemase [Phycisphaerales bacterium]|nr:glutamate racemase [Phycisphaerales bacterium]MEA2733598.1 glutamate racemase [Humisphaera sp.]